MKARVLPALLFLWLGGLSGAFLLAAGEPAVRHPLAAAQGTVAATATAPAPQAPTTAQTGGQETEPAEPAGATVKISLQDFKLVPNKVTAKAGAVTFVLTNDGRYTHDFRVEGQGVNERAPRVGQGHSREFKVTLTPGTYRISCPISNHAKRGMTGTLVVK